MPSSGAETPLSGVKPINTSGAVATQALFSGDDISQEALRLMIQRLKLTEYQRSVLNSLAGQFERANLPHQTNVNDLEAQTLLNSESGHALGRRQQQAIYYYLCQYVNGGLDRETFVRLIMSTDFIEYLNAFSQSASAPVLTSDDCRIDKFFGNKAVKRTQFVLMMFCALFASFTMIRGANGFYEMWNRMSGQNQKIITSDPIMVGLVLALALFFLSASVKDTVKISGNILDSIKQLAYGKEHSIGFYLLLIYALSGYTVYATAMISAQAVKAGAPDSLDVLGKMSGIKFNNQTITDLEDTGYGCSIASNVLLLFPVMVDFFLQFSANGYLLCTNKYVRRNAGIQIVFQIITFVFTQLTNCLGYINTAKGNTGLRMINNMPNGLCFSEVLRNQLQKMQLLLSQPSFREEVYENLKKYFACDRWLPVKTLAQAILVWLAGWLTCAFAGFGDQSSSNAKGADSLLTGINHLVQKYPTGYFIFVVLTTFTVLVEILNKSCRLN